MTLDLTLLVTAAVPTLLLAAAWGDLRSQVNSLRERGVERHAENVERMERIEDKVDRINGTVGRHDERIKSIGEELDRLRDRE